MSSVRLLLSGSLVASGLVLGTFTLHGAFDPQWPQKMQGAAGHESRPKALGAFRTKTHFVTRADAGAVKARARSDAASADAKRQAAARAAARRRVAQERAEKRRAESEKAAKASQPQQATLQWPWNWFGPE